MNLLNWGGQKDKPEKPTPEVPMLEKRFKVCIYDDDQRVMRSFENVRALKTAGWLLDITDEFGFRYIYNGFNYSIEETV